MPRRAFITDLQKAQSGNLPFGVLTLQQGEDDGQFEFEYVGRPTTDLIQPVKITAMITNLDEYPKSHEYIIFCSDDAPRHIASALQDVRGTSKKSVYELVDIVAGSLLRLSTYTDGDTQMPDSQFDEPSEDEDDDDDVYDSDHEAFEIGGQQQLTTPYSVPTPTGKLKDSDRKFRSRIRADLRATKAAGFKVGHLGHLLDGFNAFVTVSIRMSKLGISEEAMQAWQVDPKDYLILIIQYPNGYKTNEELQGLDSLRLAPNIGMRICASKKYKPTLQEAIKAFTVVKKNDRDSISNDIPSAEDEIDENSLRETFISKPLNAFLQERLVPILRFRSAGMDWRGAEDWYTELASRGMKLEDAGAIPDKFYQPEQEQHALPPIAKGDHYTQRGTTQFSFPLLAMQFSLRHFVQCTDFCLVCHRKLDTELEAIKPYVCDSSLCLYQYMTLGFGPSIEHEIVAQPYVVDLLVSFCYNSSASRKLKEFPDGLALVVPPIDLAQYNVQDPYAATYGHRHNQQQQQDKKPEKAPQDCATHEVGFDRDRLEMIFFDKPAECPVRKGSWIVVKTKGSLDGTELHCRVADVTFYPTISIDEPITLPNTTTMDGTAAAASSSAPKTITPATTPKWAPASFQVYEQDFDQLDKNGKCLAICKLLDTLPDVKALQEYLLKKRPADLRRWVDRISPAALSLLRWIIASNRACIMQVDGEKSESSRSQERLFGMKGYMQFRFAMGAPDKEQRFITEVRNTKTRLKLTYPTIFAWHGSPLHNWHMIIREGLHYKNMDHGRAYGHGVYHAKDANTSTGYSGMNYYGGGYGGQSAAKQGVWPNSVLRINSALALNELVNAPSEFTSSNPYYVVQHLDWIQTRYLFVQCAPQENAMAIGEDTHPTNAHPQDPTRTPSGISGAVAIPASAIKSGRAAKSDDHQAPSSKILSPLKRLKGLGGFSNPIAVDELDDDTASVATLDEDLTILIDEDEVEVVEITDTPIKNNSQTLPLMKSKPKGAATDFEPGTLDFSTLPVMPEPSYANSSATKRLMKELQTLAKVQEASALGDLGWYVDVEKIDNPYQWIVELHSFHVIDPKLKLVDDMKKQNVKSIVLEIRFNKDFPFTPPYVRVIRPRCMTFNEGGGGHIVMGGAMCMELLTNSGWSSVSSMESVLMQIRLAMVDNPPARLAHGGRGAGDYGAGEAADGYLRACRTHGWAVPSGFQEMAMAQGRAGGY